MLLYIIALPAELALGKQKSHEWTLPLKSAWIIKTTSKRMVCGGLICLAANNNIIVWWLATDGPCSREPLVFIKGEYSKVHCATRSWQIFRLCPMFVVVSICLAFRGPGSKGLDTVTIDPLRGRCIVFGGFLHLHVSRGCQQWRRFSQHGFGEKWANVHSYE